MLLERKRSTDAIDGRTNRNLRAVDVQRTSNGGGEGLAEQASQRGAIARTTGRSGC
jgi:hypothetical protein